MTSMNNTPWESVPYDSEVHDPLLEEFCRRCDGDGVVQDYETGKAVTCPECDGRTARDPRISTTLRRERDEARAEVERLRAAIEQHRAEFYEVIDYDMTPTRSDEALWAVLGEPLMAETFPTEPEPTECIEDRQ